MDKVFKEFATEYVKTKDRLLFEWLEDNKNRIDFRKLSFENHWDLFGEDVVCIYEDGVLIDKITISLAKKVSLEMIEVRGKED